MPLTPGTRIGTCEIIEPLGEGGMGQVFRARDLRLRRDVAIKLLLSHNNADSEHLARFEREAQTLAALNHPNIAQIYGVEEAEGGLALVMELVEGETLTEIIKRGPMRIERVLDIATQLSVALAYAHSAGVVHRDLKPANIKVRTDGTVKVLDLGLAKRRSETSAQDATVTAVSIAGAIVGTPAYMAPELLRGGAADERSDIFALGVVLFELATGSHLFRGSSVFTVAQNILDHTPPPWPNTPTGIPEGFRQVVSKAMSKHSQDRYRTVVAMHSDLNACLRAAPSGPYLAVPDQLPSVKPQQSPSLRRWLFAAAATALVIGIAGWQFRRVGAPSVTAEIKQRQVTFVGNVRGIALSPDGRTAAYATAGTQGRVMVRDIDGGQALEIWRGLLVVEIQWMPDGASVVVSGIQEDRLGLWMVPRLGGPARRLSARGAHLTVSPNGQSLALAMQNSQGFTVAAIDGGDERRVKMEGFRWLLGLDWGAKSNRVAVLTESDDGTSTIWTIGSDGTAKRRLHTGPHLSSVHWSPLDNVIYAIRSQDELADVIRLRDEDEAGEPEVVLTGLPWDTSDPYQRQGSLATDGRRLLLLRGYTYANLWKLAGKTAPVQITQGTSRYGRPRLSPTGEWIATSLGNAAKSAIVKISSGGGEPTPLTSGKFVDINPAWSPDGNRVAYLSTRSGSPRIWIVNSDAGESFELKDSATENTGDVAWLGDDRLSWALPGEGNYAIRNLRSGAQELLLTTADGWWSDLRVAPNGKRLALWWNSPSGETDDGLWTLEWPSRERRKLKAGNYYPAGWSADGASIFAYSHLGREVLRISTSNGASQIFGEFPSGAVEGCDVTPDGSSVICAVRETHSDMWLVENLGVQSTR